MPYYREKTDNRALEINNKTKTRKSKRKRNVKALQSSLKKTQLRNKTFMENGFFTSANSTQTRTYKIIARMLYIYNYNISIVSIDLRYFLCGITKS